MEHGERNKLLTANQYVFLKGRPTTTAIINLAESIIDNLEDEKIATGLILDFSKAFYYLGHIVVIKQLDYLGISGTALDWFRSYL